MKSSEEVLKFYPEIWVGTLVIMRMGAATS